MDIVLKQRGTAAGHDEVRVAVARDHDAGVLYEIRAVANTGVACPFVLTEHELEGDAPAGTLDLSRGCVTRIVGALEAADGRDRTVTNYDTDDFRIVHDRRREVFNFIDLAEGERVSVFDSASTREALAEALKIALHYHDRDARG